MTTTADQLLPDDFRPYNLIPTTDSTIPTRALPGEPGSHWVARGLMVETCAQLLGRPVRLEHYLHEHLTYISAHVSLASSILASDPLGAVVAVDLMIGRDTRRWALIFQNRIIGTGQDLPSPRHLAGLAATVLDDRRRPITDTCRGPVERPSHLW